MLELGIWMVAINFSLGILVVLIAMYSKEMFTPAWRIPWLVFASSGVILTALTGILPALFVSYRDNLYSLVLPSIVIVADRVFLIIIALLFARVAYRVYRKRFNHGYFMIDESTFGSIRDRLNKLYGEAPTRVLMYVIGKEAGAKAENLIGMSELKGGGRNFLEAVFALQSEVGWGAFEIEKFDEDDELIIRVDDCFESKIGEGQRHRCDFLRGYISGVVSLIFKDLTIETEEQLCVSYGDSHCRFVSRFSFSDDLKIPEE